MISHKTTGRRSASAPLLSWKEQPSSELKSIGIEGQMSRNSCLENNEAETSALPSPPVARHSPESVTQMGRIPAVHSIDNVGGFVKGAEVPPAGLEPATSNLARMRSNQLSYGGTKRMVAPGARGVNVAAG